MADDRGVNITPVGERLDGLKLATPPGDSLSCSPSSEMGEKPLYGFPAVRGEGLGEGEGVQRSSSSIWWNSSSLGRLTASSTLKRRERS